MPSVALLAPDAPAFNRSCLQETLIELGAAAGRMVEPYGLAKLAASRAVELLSGDSAAVWLWRDDEQRLKLLARTPAALHALDKADAAVALALQLRQPILRGGVAAVPLLTDGRAVGVLAVRTRDRSNFTQAELTSLNMIAAQLAPMLEAVRLRSQVRQAQAQFRALSEIAFEGIGTVDSEGCLSMVNRQLCDLLGYDQTEMVGRSMYDFMPPEEAAGVRQRFEHRAETLFKAERLVQRKDGSRVWLEMFSTSVSDGPTNLGAVAVFNDLSAQRTAEEALAHQALHDNLTCLPNRTLLRDRLQQAMFRAHRQGGSVALLFLDLDRFKEVNEGLGHACGDSLLRQVSARLRSLVRESDTVARLGDDEFAMLLPECGADDAVRASDKILSAFETPFILEGHVLDASASVGMAVYPAHGTDAATLMRHADMAMCAAKRGQNGAALFSADQDNEPATRLSLTAELRSAIDHDELVLCYQPKVELADGRQCEVEALVRWRHPRLGLLGPSTFVPLAEQTGLIKPLTGWVLNEACRQQKAWKDRGLDMTLAVNLSMRNLLDPDLPEFIVEVLERHDVTPESVVLELTETMVMADPQHKLDILRLRAMGLRLSIDDFGTGYSSLSYLRQLPVSEIKIDQSFVRDLATDENNAVIVRSTIDLGHNLGLHVVAEGVETAETYAWLAELGCDAVQGYYIARPLPPDELEAWANQRRAGQTL